MSKDNNTSNNTSTLSNDGDGDGDESQYEGDWTKQCGKRNCQNGWGKLCPYCADKDGVKHEDKYKNNCEHREEHGFGRDRKFKK